MVTQLHFIWTWLQRAHPCRSYDQSPLPPSTGNGHICGNLSLGRPLDTTRGGPLLTPPLISNTVSY
eukprot:772992-Amphidinium_carterae.1